MWRALAGRSCKVVSSSSEESRKADSVTLDEGFQTCLEADID